MPKERKDKHHKRSKQSRTSVEYKLLTYAALGQQSKITRLFSKQQDLDVNFYDAHGSTALHQV